MEARNLAVLFAIAASACESHYGMGPGPYTFRVTDVNGAVIEDSGVPFNENGDSVGTNQFPPCS
jgi:hypothetical protein